jgi:preprotein translocase subunit SecA
MTQIAPSEQEYLKARWVKEVDHFWSNYLESLNKIKELVKIKGYLPQEPQEAFF